MDYTVQVGDDLPRIAGKTLGDQSRWPEIARLNSIGYPFAVLVGQVLRLPPRGDGLPGTGGPASVGPPQAVVPGTFHLFVLADEVNPLRGKVVRRVLVNPRMTAAAAARLGRPLPVFPHPERYGFTPSNPTSALPVGRHAMGMKPSPYLSASRSQPFGARRFVGTPFWIDEARARAAGATFHEVEEIVADLRRILSKARDAASIAKLQALIGIVQADREVLLRGPIPAAAVKGPLAMGLTRGLQGVQIIGFAMTAVDIKHPADRSAATHSVRPLAAESIRQAGGWTAAWAGMRLGALGGAAIGIETGPGALVTGALGGIAGGVVGYFGFGWIADHVDHR